MSPEESKKDQFLREQFLKVLRELGQELLPEDELIANTFLHSHNHLSAADLHNVLREEHPEISLSHVRRTLRLLKDLGIARQVQLDTEDRVVYEHLHLGSHHDHMVCVLCGKIHEFVSSTIEKEQIEACRKRGFQPLTHSLEIRGICADCLAKFPPTRLLTSCLVGETVQVVEILGGHGIRRRLMDLGLVPGTTVQVLSAAGPLALSVRGSRIAIGRGQARKVIVKRPTEKNRPITHNVEVP